MPSQDTIKTIVRLAIEKILIAKELFENHHYKDSASRAYYGVFHFLTAVLLTRSLTFSSHSQIIGNFNKEFIKTGLFPNDFNKKIEKLFVSRQIGDYDPESILTCENTEQLIFFADEIADKCIEYLSNFYQVSSSFWKK